MNKRLEKKLKELPAKPGVYFHKNPEGEIIYVGKAAILRNRVRQYFQASRNRDPKTEALVSEIADTDWMTVDSEIEALFLEAEMIRRYLPRYNILLRDDKSLIYIRIDYDSDYPTVTTTRRPLDDGARYYGPYLSAGSVRQALKLLRRIFPYAVKRAVGQNRASLYYHLGLDPGLEDGRTSLADYRANLRRLMAVIEGKRLGVEHEIEREMKKAAKDQNFEQAARLRNQLSWLRNLTQQVIFSDKEFLDISKDHALTELVDLLCLKDYPKRIEGYDISHQQGSDVVASMVVFTNGVSDKGNYRKFKTKKNQNNDFFNMYETLTRRFSPKNINAWGLPSLVLIDGGKGQLESAIRARDEAGVPGIPFIGLAKREEQIVIRRPLQDNMTVSAGSSNIAVSNSVLQKLGGFSSVSKDFVVLTLPHNTNLVKLLQRIRDESHRFAVSYHSVLKLKRQKNSILDEIPGIGSITRRKLLRRFGSLSEMSRASVAELAEVVGKSKAEALVKILKS